MFKHLRFFFGGGNNHSGSCCYNNYNNGQYNNGYNNGQYGHAGVQDGQHGEDLVLHHWVGQLRLWRFANLETVS